MVGEGRGGGAGGGGGGSEDSVVRREPRGQCKIAVIMVH